MVRRKVFVNREVKGIQMKTHPEFFELSEKFRIMAEKQGVKLGQKKTTLIMARHIKIPKGGLKFLNGTKKFKKK